MNYDAYHCGKIAGKGSAELLQGGNSTGRRANDNDIKK